MLLTSSACDGRAEVGLRRATCAYAVGDPGGRGREPISLVHSNLGRRARETKPWFLSAWRTETCLGRESLSLGATYLLERAGVVVVLARLVSDVDSSGPPGFLTMMRSVGSRRADESLEPNRTL